ncbi:MFS transporter [Algimonas arctica]|uniref:2-oxoglutarate dehydrogenase E1 component n=1 Tax=Algimonas arctica TaxID=1479486 RepID=A0A8J3G2E1_9PROT|nr:alpha-ketoacid dehydrogenase subunit alpha/beta [Algimonas arctica]GHA92827.1 MFS transporter [Algimonas arctica]
MSYDHAETVHRNFLSRVGAGDLPTLSRSLTLKSVGLTDQDLVALFDAQLMSRHLDRVALKLQARGEGFYTIASSGHEGNAAIAWATRPDDMAFLHYRDATFQIARSLQVPGTTPLWDMLLSFSTSKEDPTSGGRHKVLGSKALAIPPQTSTIASHLPKALGAAFSIPLSKRITPEHQQLKTDGIIVCTFGDASLNHSTSQGALNTASWTAFQGSPLPLLFVCEDNGIGISTKTPANWVEQSVKSRPALEYFQSNSLDIVEAYDTASKAVDYVRRYRRPAFLHAKCVRLYGHAGPDAPSTYLSKSEIKATEAQDPLLYTAARLVSEGVMTPADIVARYEQTAARVERVAEQAIKRPRLSTAQEVAESLVPPARICTDVPAPSEETRNACLGDSDLRATGQPQHMAKMINLALTDLMLAHEEIIVAGEDVGRKGGVYGVTQRLQKRFGAHRVIDSLLDEQAILGLGIGMAHNGFLPIPEIQFLAYLHNAIDQLRGEAATLPFFSKGQFTNPMVIRIAGLGYQRGFGGHFHNENSVTALRDIPGLIVACPSNGRDAVLMLRECVRLAREEQRLVVFLEPIALYMTRDLHAPGDGEWTFAYPQPDTDDVISLGDVGVHGTGKDLAIITYGNGAYLSQQAQKILKADHNIDCRVIDMRWLSPLPKEAILKAVDGASRVLIVDECREQGSHSEALMALFAESSDLPTVRHMADDCFIATGPAFGVTMPDRDSIVERAVTFVKEARS